MMKIELGKKYRLRNGNVVGPIQNIPPEHYCPADAWYDPLTCTSWQPNGLFDPTQGVTGFDIVAEYVEPKEIEAFDAATGEVLDDPYSTAASDAVAEVRRALTLWPDSVPFNTMHEGFAIINEEFDELKEQVWMNQRKRDLVKARKEAVQLAAMAIRFAAEMCTEERGRK